MAAVIGGIWACVYMIATVRFGGRRLALWFANWLLIPCGMIQVSYPSNEWRERMRGILCLYLSTMLMGGISHLILERTALGQFWQYWMSGTGEGAVSIWLLAMAMAGGFAAVEAGMRYRSASRRREQIQEVKLYCGDSMCTVMALWDSGNQLYDPFTGRGVHILEHSVGRELLGEAMYDAVVNYGTGSETCEWVHLIPCRSIGREHMLLPVFAVDRMRLADGRVLERPIIGLSKGNLSADSSYRMLLHGQTEG